MKKNPTPPRGKKGGTCGAYRRNFPRSVAWAVDQDYLDKLSPEEREWLARFNDAHYGADFRGANPDEWPVEKRRERYNAKNAANADFFAPLSAQARLVPVEDGLELPAEEHDAGPPPAYLSSPAYKAHLAAYRATLSPARQPAKPKDTPEFQEARGQLQRFVAQHTPNPQEDIQQ